MNNNGWNIQTVSGYLVSGIGLMLALSGTVDLTVLGGNTLLAYMWIPGFILIILGFLIIVDGSN